MSSVPDPAEALNHVVLEEAPAAEVVAWASDELLAGRTFSDVVNDLVDQGWDPAAAEAAVEQARVQTRAARGVMTRDDIVGELDRRHRPATTGLSAFYRCSIGPLGVLSFITGLRAALAAAVRLRQVARERRRDC
jgi:hypothetical protein